MKMNCKYKKIVGIGGIGTGLLFHTHINAALGRSESRLAELSAAKDYCKLHIVFHYVSTLLSPDAAVYPIGFVGNDAYGGQLIRDIRGAGMDAAYIKVEPSLPTMLSICLQYPDKETCNFTASNSACNQVTPEYVRDCLDRINIGADSVVAAIPEVSVDSRIELLKIGKEQGAFCVLSVPEAEADELKAARAFEYCDLVAVNYSEALALVTGNKSETLTQATEDETDALATASGDDSDVMSLAPGDKSETLATAQGNESEALALAPGDEDELTAVKRLYEYLRGINPRIMLLVTLGPKGAFSAYMGQYERVPCLPAEAVNTTGAGDACLGGTIAGLARGMPFQKGRDDRRFGESALTSAVELGTLCAGMAVETADSIAAHVNAQSILKRIEASGWKSEMKFK